MEAWPRRATFIVNRAARRVARDFDGARVVRYLARRGIEAQLGEPASAAETVAAARAAAEAGHDFVFALGGDGTQRNAAEGLAGSGTALAALPGGTVNIWCREAGIPRTLRAAVDAHIAGQLATIDLGYAGSQPFLLMASVGWDAAIAARVNPRLKKRLGDYAYMLEAARALPWLTTERVSWRTGLATYEAPLAVMVISNSRLYGGRVSFSPGATIDDGLLDIAALCPRERGDGLRLAYRLVRSRLHGAAALIETRAADLEVETPDIPVQADGDPIGETPMRFRVAAGALRVSLPAGPLPPLFSTR